MMDFVSPLAIQQIMLDDEDFVFFRQQLYQKAGITLSEKKMDLVQTRIRPRVQELGLKSFKEYRSLLESLDSVHPEWQNFINRLTTNKTDFFREEKHFFHLTENALPEWKKKNQDILHVWSAACSTGEEPYTLAMVLQNCITDKKFQIHASDIDTSVIKRASNAVYPAAKIFNEVPESFISGSFNFGRDDLSDWARVSPQLKEKVRFFQHNLLTEDVPLDCKPDIIFLRNVLIYFSRETITSAVENLYQVAAPGAYLYIGHSESLNGVKTRWKSVSPSIYIKK